MLADSDGPETSPGILDGVRILDCSRGMAGPLATLLLAEAGADVVKVEPPEGDPVRLLPGFATWNRSKRGMVLDLAQPEGLARFDALLPQVDVVVHDFSAVTGMRLGLDRDSLKSRASGLVVCRVGAFPTGHPDADRSAWDPLVLARLGILDEQRGHRPGPVYVRFPLGSLGAAYLAAAGIVARLLVRVRTGGGGLVSTSLAQGALLPMMMHWFRAERPTEGLSRGMPKDRAVTLFECSDGIWIHIMQAPDATPLMLAAFAAMGPEAVAAANARVPAHPLCPNQGANAAAFLQRPSAEWLTHLWEHDIPAQAVAPFGSAYFDDQVRANGYAVEICDPGWGSTWQAGPPLHTDPPSRVRGPAPTLGQHTEEVLAEYIRRRPPRPDATRLGAHPVEDGNGDAAPLHGLRVVDLGSYLAGPLGPMLLADLGADVVKVEPPSGDAMRWNEASFEGCQRGKRSLVLDLRDPGQRPLLERLVASADVVHHNIRRPAATRIGVDPASLRAINPDLVFCHVSSYGPRGPRADWPGYDQLFQSITGWESEAAGRDNPPMWHRFGMMDHQAASASVVATLLALYHRERTGQGQDVAASLLGAAVMSMSVALGRPDGTVEGAGRVDRLQTGVGPAARLYPTVDGWVSVMACQPDGVEALCAAVGAVDSAALPARFEALTQSECLDVLARAGIAAEPVRLDQRMAFFDSPDNRNCRLTVAYDHATYGRMEQIGALWDFDDLPLQLDRASPAIGQHSAEIIAS
ncbi:MAG TPA: CoA transferase, partial [Acidimicrobiales bacterium]|nr:CoA transferase [Acidimicrobiales bacterium]